MEKIKWDKFFSSKKKGKKIYVLNSSKCHNMSQGYTIVPIIPVTQPDGPQFDYLDTAIQTILNVPQNYHVPIKYAWKTHTVHGEIKKPKKE